MLTRKVCFVLLSIATVALSRPTASYINCDATSRNRQTSTFIYDRSTVMGSNTPIDYNPPSPLIEYELEADGSVLLSFTHGDSNCVVHTNDGEFTMVEGSASPPSNDACTSWNDILYQVDGSAVISWRPRSESSMIWIFQGTRGTRIYVQRYQASDFSVAETDKPTSMPTGTDIVETASPTSFPTAEILETPAPTQDDSNTSPPQEVGGGSVGEGDSETQTKDTIFGIAVVTLTGFYLSFLWSTLK